MNTNASSEQTVEEYQEPFLWRTLKIMRQKLSAKSHELVTILENCLHLNPYFRMTAAECLSNSVFDPVRDNSKEIILNYLG